MTRLREELVAWSVSGRVALGLFVVPFVVAIALAVLRGSDRGLAFSLIGEDHVLEWLQAVGFAVAGIFGAFAAGLLLRQGNRFPALAYLLFAAGCLFVAGEEISWAQRLIGFGTPQVLTERNDQGETTLHNVGPVEESFDRALLVIALYGTIAPWAVSVLRRSSTLFVPPLFLTSAFLIPVAHKLAEMVELDEFPYDQFYNEVKEFSFAFGIAAFSVLSWRLRRRGAVSTRRGRALRQATSS